MQHWAAPEFKQRHQMRGIKVLIAIVGIVIVAGGGWMMWRSTHPALSDEEQIHANLQAITDAAARHSSGGILDYLADGFTWNGQNRHDVASMLSGAMFEFNEVRIQTAQISVQPQGALMVSKGEYTLIVRERKATEPHTYRGQFEIEWQKQGRHWLAIKATSEGDSPI